VPRAGRVEVTRKSGSRPVVSQRAHQATPMTSTEAAVLDLQRASGNRAVVRLLAVQRDEARATELVTAGRRLGDVQGWASDQQRSQKALDTSAVVGLDLSQKANVVAAIKALSAALPALRRASSPYAPGLSALRQALEKTRDTEAALKAATDELDRLRAGQILKEGQAAMARAITALQSAKGVSAQLKRNLRILHDNMAGTAGIHDTFNGITRVIRDVEALDTDQGVKPEAVERVLFLLRSFVAVNDPTSADVPKPAEVAAMKSRLGSMQEDFAAVFGSGSQFGLLIDYADRLVRQIDVRGSMAKAGAPVGQVPGEADARAYFTKLQKRPNAEVFDAYTAFMSAFFYHRVVASIGDLTATNAALMSVPASITGTRPLVCTGYATLGAELLHLAGATKGEIILGFRASDAQLLSGKDIDAGHAIAKISRAGQTRYVSNHLVVATEEDGIGPDAVAWTNKDSPLIRAKGPTMAAAVTAVMDAMAEARAAARARSAKGKTNPKKAKP
jgi:hypothetical protein